MSGNNNAQAIPAGFISFQKACELFYKDDLKNWPNPYRLQNKLFESQMESHFISGKIESFLQLQDGKLICIDKNAWLLHRLEYKFFQDSARLTIKTKECVVLYSGNILVDKEGVEAVLNEEELFFLHSGFSNTKANVQDVSVITVEKPLRPNQRHRERCRAIAAMLWSKNPDMPIAQMAICDDIIQFGCEGKVYADDETVRNWIKDLHPNPQAGRPKKKLPV